MTDYCVTVADMARARFFALEPVASPDFNSGPNLTERGSLTIPPGELRDRDIFTDTETGCNHGPGGATHSYDDHRSRHRLEFERRFAKRVVAEILRLARQWKVKHLVLAANSRMLNLLRTALPASAATRFEIRELARDMTKLTPVAIHQHLAKAGLVPARKTARRRSG